MAIRRELGEVDGVGSVDVDVPARQVTVRYGPPADWDRIARTLEEIGYPAQAEV